jgi:hypothetical protein
MAKLLKVEHTYFNSSKKVANILVFNVGEGSVQHHIIDFYSFNSKTYGDYLIGCWRVKYKTK